jgi:hypothetical protein
MKRRSITLLIAFLVAGAVLVVVGSMWTGQLTRSSWDQSQPTGDEGKPASKK